VIVRRWSGLLFLAAGAAAVVERPNLAEPGPSALGGPVSSFGDEGDRPEPRLRWRARPLEESRAAVEVVGVEPGSLQALRLAHLSADQWQAFFAVRVLRDDPSGSGTAPAPPLWGAYSLQGEAVRFVPRFPLEPGLRYRAEFDPARLRAVIKGFSPAAYSAHARPARAGPAIIVADFAVPSRPRRPAAKVVAVYPSGDTLPENLLRFYIHFSAPMSRGEAYHRIRLLDAAGKPVDSPFLELAEELWSGDGMRFTLLFQPGRIKRGLKPREEAGPILQAGRSYCLVVDRDWLDAEGNPMQASARKPFRAGPPDETSPNPATWTLRPPRSGSKDPFEARFSEPLDHALLERLLSVRDGAGRIVPGGVAVSAGETAWSLTPLNPWQPGEYRLEVGTELEDLAANSVARPFEVDVTRPITARVTQEVVALPFRVLGPR
jgi:hypothetical protein